MISSMGMNYGEFVWWQGVIVDIKDPKGAGRVRVRIFGYHDETEETVKNADLPWSMVGLPTTSAGISGEGESHGLLQGSWVMGFFMDGKNAQIPVVLFSLPGISKKSNTAFADPDGVYPLYEDEPDTNKLYRGDDSAPEYKSKKENHIDSVESADGELNYVPRPKINKGYMNKVISRGGNTIELDGDSSNPRISVYHRSGSYLEFLPNGNVTLRVTGNLNMIVDKNIIIKGKSLSSSSDTLNLMASGSTNVKSHSLKMTSSGETSMSANAMNISAEGGTSIKSNSLDLSSASPMNLAAKYIKFKTAAGELTSDKLISTVKKVDECNCDNTQPPAPDDNNNTNTTDEWSTIEW